MLGWETLNLYCLNDARWFETSERYSPDGAHLAVYRASMPDGWRLRRRGLWFIAEAPGVPMARQGFKLHVSAPVGQTVEVLRRCLPVMRDAGVHFKFLLDPWANQVTSKKSWSRGSSGKFITVYPAPSSFGPSPTRSPQRWTRSAGPTSCLTAGTRTPRRFTTATGASSASRGCSPTDAQPDDRGPAGALVPDVRHPYWSAPAWVDDPFAAGEAEADDDAAGGPLGGRFAITSALTVSNAGGIYRATDEHTGAEVIVKEARPHVVAGTRAAPAITLLEKEHRLLTALADTGYFVAPVSFFRAWSTRSSSRSTSTVSISASCRSPPTPSATTTSARRRCARTTSRCAACGDRSPRPSWRRTSAGSCSAICRSAT